MLSLLSNLQFHRYKVPGDSDGEGVNEGGRGCRGEERGEKEKKEGDRSCSAHRAIRGGAKLPREEKEGPTLLLYQRGQGCCLPSIPAGPREDDYRNMFIPE